MFESPEKQAENRAQLVKNLHALAEWFLEHPEVEVPYELRPGHKFTCSLPYDKSTRDKQIRAIGSCDKKYDEHFLNLQVEVGDYTLEWFTNRNNVCTKRVVGAKFVPEKVHVVPAHSEDIVEWDCHPVLADE